MINNIKKKKQKQKQNWEVLAKKLLVFMEMTVFKSFTECVDASDLDTKRRIHTRNQFDVESI